MAASTSGRASIDVQQWGASFPSRGQLHCTRPYAPRTNFRYKIVRSRGSDGIEDTEPNWDEEMSIFKRRTLKPSQLEALRKLEEEKVDVGRVRDTTGGKQTHTHPDHLGRHFGDGSWPFTLECIIHFRPHRFLFPAGALLQR